MAGLTEMGDVNGTDAQERPVVVATIEHPTGETGVHTHFVEFQRWARARNVPVHLVTPFQAPPVVLYSLFGAGRLARPISMPFWVWWYRWTHALILKRELRRQLLACGPSVVYAQDPLSAKAAIDLRDAGAPIEVVLIVHFNGSSAEELATKGQIARGGTLYRDILSLEREVLSSADRVIFPSRYAARAASFVPEDEPERAHSWLIPNFVARPAREPSHGVHGDAITIGTLEPRKNHEFILRVFAEAHRRGRKYALTMVGSGPLGPSLRALARRLGIEGSVRFTGGRPGAAALVAHHRVYVHSAWIENCPLVVLEAMAAGVPVLAPPVGGIPELLTNGVEGLFWDLNDVSSAADILIALLEDESRRRSMGAAARARYERDYSPDARCPALLAALLGTGCQRQHPSPHAAGGRTHSAASGQAGVPTTG